MRDGWVETKLIDVVEVLDRYRKPINSTEREVRQGPIPYYGANGQTGWIDDFLFNEELVLLAEDAIDFSDPHARKAYLISGPSWVNNHAHVLRIKPAKTYSYFLAEALNKVDYSQYVSFGTRSKLTQASMNGIKVLLPPLPEQKRIVDLISSVDSYIEALQQQEDFARMALKALSQKTFSNMNDSVQLDTVATCIMGQSPEGATCNKDGIGTPLLTGPTEFERNNLVGPPRQWTTNETKISLLHDILFCVRGATAGRMNLANYRSVIGRGLAAIRCENPLDTHYVRFALQFGLHQLLPAAGGTIFPNISQSQLRGFTLPWPNEDDRRSSTGLLKSVEETAKTLSSTVLETKNLRNSLLSDLLSGNHEIPATYDKIMGAA